MSTQKRVFISYARDVSNAHALALQGALGTERCFLDLEDVPPDKEFPQRLADALLGAEVVVVLASSAYFQRWYCLREWLLARAPWDARPVDGEAAGEQGRLGHLLVALDQLEPNDRYRLPEPIQRRNLLPASAVHDIAILARRLLEGAAVTLAERLEGYRVPADAVDMLVGAHVLPVPPQTLAGIPMWPLTLRPSLGERFVGRTNEFWQMHEALWGTRVGGAAAAGLTNSLHGAAGFGKTQLALEYLHRMGPRLYRGGLMWVDASEASAPLEDQLRGILKCWGVATQELDGLPESALRDRLAEVLHYRDPSRPVLFVVDNLPEPTADKSTRDLSEYCPALGKVTCLVTSRATLPHINVIPVDVISKEAAVALLKEGVAPDRLSPEQWSELAAWMGYWPLGLDHLNAFMRVDPQSPATLLQRSRTKEPSDELDHMAGILKNEMPRDAVRGATDLFGASLKALSVPARDLLFRCAWLAQAPIPRGFVEVLCLDTDAGHAVVLSLLNRSWLKPAGADTLLIHPVIASYLRAAQSDASVRIGKLLKVMNAIWSATDTQVRGRSDLGVALAPHAAMIIESAARSGSPGAPLVELLDSMREIGSQIADSAPLMFAVSAATRVNEIAGNMLAADDAAALQVALGDALQILGNRDNDSQRLEEAVAAYRAALRVRTRDRLPLAWATTQNNLGVVLDTLGNRDQDSQRLQEAAAAYRAALAVYAKDRVPLSWAATQNNLGVVLTSLGNRERNSQRLHEAVAAYRAALEVRTKDGLPLDWALTQNNLGNTLVSLGSGGQGPERLEEAEAANRAALEASTKDHRPLDDWALTQNNLCVLQRVPGDSRHDPQRSETVASHSALKVNLEDPALAWPMAESNRSRMDSDTHSELDSQRLPDAGAAYRAMLEVRMNDRLTLNWTATQNMLGIVLESLENREQDAERLREAGAAYEAALEVYTKDRLPLNWAATQNNLGVVLTSLGNRQRDSSCLGRAVAAYRAALEVYTKDHLPRQCARTQRNLEHALRSIAEIPGR